MPEFGSAHISGRIWRKGTEFLRRPWLAVSMTAVLLLGAWGCDDDGSDDEDVAIRHAEVRAQFQADLTILSAREWALLHDQSDRQRHAREQLIYLEEIQDRIPEHPPGGELEQRIQAFEQMQRLMSGPSESESNDEEIP